MGPALPLRPGDGMSTRMTEVTTKRFWWQRFDWSSEMGISDAHARAAMLAEMLADDDAQYQRYFDMIYADILWSENRLN